MNGWVKAGTAAAAVLFGFGCAHDQGAEREVEAPAYGGAGEAGIPAGTPQGDPTMASEYDEGQQGPQQHDPAAANEPAPQDTGGDPLPPEAKVGDEGRLVDDRSITADNPAIPSEPQRFPPPVDEEAQGARELDAEELGDGDQVFPGDHSARDEQLP